MIINDTRNDTRNFLGYSGAIPHRVNLMFSCVGDFWTLQLVVAKTTCKYSLNELEKIVRNNTRRLKPIVEKATGLHTRRSDLVDNIASARVILAGYAFRVVNKYNAFSPEEKRLSVIDIVAALCSFRHQKDAKTSYEFYWRGQKTQGTNPSRLLEIGLNAEDPRVPVGVLQIFYYRFAQYRAAFRHETPSHNGYMAMQAARIDAYAKILLLYDVDRIVEEAHRFDEACLQAAQRIADEYVLTYNQS